MAARLKRYAWRTTGAVAWIHYLVNLVAGRDLFAGLQDNFVSRLGSFLSSIKFAPVNPAHLLQVLKWGWILLAAGFDWGQLVGLALYVLCFPLLTLGYLFFNEVIREQNSSPSSVSEQRGLLPKRSSRPLIPCCGSLLLGWSVLYGGTTVRVQIVAGLLLSGLLLVCVVYRSFQRTRPIDSGDRRLFGSLESWGITFVNNIVKRTKTDLPTSKFEVSLSVKLYGLFQGMFRNLALAARGRKGKDRLGILLLTDYVLSFLTLGASAILFWSLAVRLSVPPHTISFIDAASVSAAHFLPGFAPSISLRLPSWVEIGPSITAWLLFVIYAGPAASLLPMKQQFHLGELEATYRHFRFVAVYLRKYVLQMGKLKSKLP